MAEGIMQPDNEKKRTRPEAKQLSMNTNVAQLSAALDPQVINQTALHRAATFHRLMGMVVWSDPGDHMAIISALKPMPPTPEKVRRVSTDVEAQKARSRTRPSRFCTVPNLFGLSVLEKKRESSLYWTVVKDENRSRRLYNVTLWYVYLFYLAQLTIAAALIILGAIPNDHHISIAVLGAVTGVITGLLSLIQKQGLPNRALQYKFHMRAVREDIEYTERRLRAGDIEIDPYKAAEDLRLRYLQAREDKNANLPDHYVSQHDHKLSQKEKPGHLEVDAHVGLPKTPGRV